MLPAILHVRAKTQEAWESLGPAVEYLIKNVKFSIKEYTNCGLKWQTTVEEAEKAHTILTTYKLPLTIELIIEEFQ